MNKLEMLIKTSGEEQDKIIKQLTLIEMNFLFEFISKHSLHLRLDEKLLTKLNQKYQEFK